MEKSNIIVKISGDSAEFKKAIEKAEQTLEEFKKTSQDVSKYVNGWAAQLTKWGLALHGLEKTWEILKMGISIFTEMGNSLKRVSERTGIAVSSLSALKYAAEQSGTSFETMVDSLKTFQEQLGAVQLGDPGILPLNILVHPASAYRPFNFQVNVVEQNHF